MKILNALNLNKNQIQNGLIHPLASAPSSPSVGQAYYDTATLQLLTWNGSAWTNKGTDGALLNGQNAAFYLGRANHTGTQTASTISDLSTVVQAYRLDQFAVPTGSVNFNSQKITNLLDPTNPQEGATKNYVDSQVSLNAAGIDSKASVRVVSTSNQTLSGTPTVDSVALSAGNRILLTAQTTGSENGVYVVAAGAWSRAVDADATGELTPGATWYVEEGTTYGTSTWRITSTGTITLGSTSITINQFTGGTSYSAGSAGGILLTGSIFTIKLPASSGLITDSTGLYVDRTKVPFVYSALIGDGSTTNIVVTHSLGTKAVIVQAYEVSSDDAVGIDWTATSTTTITAKFTVAPTASAIRIVIMG